MGIQFENGLILFDEGSIAFHEDCCCLLTVPCSRCLNEIAPQFMTVTPTGVSADTCPECELLNKDFTMEFSFGCIWAGQLIDICIPGGDWIAGPLSLEVSKVGAIWRVQVVVVNELFSSRLGQANYRKEYASAPDCFSFDEEELPLFSNTGTETCDWPTSVSVSSGPPS